MTYRGSDRDGWVEDDASGPVTASQSANAQTTVVGQGAHAVSIRGRDGGATAEVEPDGVSPALRGSGGGGSRQYVMTEPEPDALGPCVECAARGHSHEEGICLARWPRSDSVCPCNAPVLMPALAGGSAEASGCPRCGAQAGEPCRTPSGKATRPHAARGRAEAEQADRRGMSQVAQDEVDSVDDAEDRALIEMEGGVTHTLARPASEDGSGRGTPIVFQKVHNAATSDDAETWEAGPEAARTINPHDMARSDGGGVLVGAGPEYSLRTGFVEESADVVHTLEKAAAPPAVLDTYNQNQVEGGVTNTLSTSPTTAVEGGPEAECTAESPCARCRELDPPPDGYRYAACGDGVAAPCAHFIGLRIRGYGLGDPRALALIEGGTP